MTGVAVKVTLVPVQIDPAGTAAILTLAGSTGFTVMASEFDVAGLPDGQGTLEVITQVIISPLTRVLVVYVAFVSPVRAVPFFFH